MNSYLGKNATLFKWTEKDEQLEEMERFEYGFRAEAHFSCSVTYQNRMMVFGGARTSRTFSEVVDCGLETIGHAPVGLLDVACGAFTIDQRDVVLLCFPVVIRTHYTQFCWR